MDDIFKLILPSQPRHIHDCSPEFGEAAGTVDVLLPDVRRHAVRLILHQAETLVDRMKPILFGQLNDQVVSYSASAFGWMDSSLTIQFCTSMISMPSSPMRLTTRVMPELMIMRRHMAHEVVSCRSSPSAALRPTR